MRTISGEEVNLRLHGVWVSIQKAGFWWLILFMLGVGTGFKLAEGLFSQKFDNAIKLGGIIHKQIVYDIKLRP